MLSMGDAMAPAIGDAMGDAMIYACHGSHPVVHAIFNA